jgi:hypothetical protein
MKRIISLIRLNFNQYHFILIWTLLNIVQIGATELTSDEGYYWFYSSKLEWGYYDHPPFLALLIKIGTSLFSGEIGVRLFNVLLMSIGLIFLFKIDQWNKREKNLIYLIIISIPLFNYITFIAFPDTPLVAFSMICLYAYKRLLDKNNLMSSLFFGVSIALMLYSKYHAVVFVFFILLSNLSLLKNKFFYISVILSGILFVPHLLWQFQHDFPSFQFHLYGRTSQFEFANVFQYISQQIPMIGIGIIFVPFIYKAENQFEKTLKYIAIGTFLFFLLSTARGFVHLHWTSIVLFPIIILSAKYYSARRNNRLFNFLIIPVLILILAVRAYLILPVLSFNTLNVDYYHGRNKWAEDIKVIAGNRPVVFETGNGALREAPLYSFYSKKTGIAFYPGDKKKSQYQIWNYEDSVQSKSVILIRGEKFVRSKELRTRMGKTINYKEIANFITFNNIRILCNANDIYYNNDTVKIPVRIINHRQYPLHITSNQFIYITLRNEKSKEFTFKQRFNKNMLIEPCDTAKYVFTFNSKRISDGKYDFILGINDGITYPSINSKKNNLLIGIN